jgi:hypothetical protein
MLVGAILGTALVVRAGGPPGYSGTTWSDVDESYPQDEEDATYGAAAIRQTRRIAKSMFTVEHGSNGVHKAESIVASYLASNAVTTAKIADGAVTGAKIANGSITFDMFASTNRVHTTSGYDKLPSGLIIQWAVGSYETTEGSQDVTFPLAFPTACLAVIVGTQAQSASGNADHMYQLISYSTTAATIYKQHWSGNQSVAIRPTVLAIGY